MAGLSLPQAIKEVSEPVTPAYLSSPGSENARSLNTSALTDTLQTSFAKLKQNTAIAPGSADTKKKNEKKKKKNEKKKKKKNDVNTSEDIDIPEVVIVEDGIDCTDEGTPLLHHDEPQNANSREIHRDSIDVEGQTARPPKHNRVREIYTTARRRTRQTCHTLLTPKSWDGRALWEKGVKEPVGLLPCVFLGVLLNVLDALSYGQCSSRIPVYIRADYM